MEKEIDMGEEIVYKDELKKLYKIAVEQKSIGLALELLERIRAIS